MEGGSFIDDGRREINNSLNHLESRAPYLFDISSVVKMYKHLEVWNLEPSIKFLIQQKESIAGPKEPMTAKSLQNTDNIYQFVSTFNTLWKEKMHTNDA